ncbi:Histidine kinase [Lentibacillus sp. JNUCC-1]|uniref:cell wall metabolism sensor histidine kinase WalK n=1 Tax=Lentibacillus sp. JNUCC-1 TaxID=2654513 RepID=UPI0012E83617|nr:cell wall metabolism sensor histidine kinase WalK [Lentibacillus sp. JNUCC-1]MUV37916.1 Histidine kinase [Lentibacillus sp. JNUCC-1]
MHKVGFFRSVQLKFIIVYILLLLIAIQVIGSYFVRQLEEELVDNFKTSIDDRIDVVNVYLEQAFEKERPEDGSGPTLQEEIQRIVNEVDTAEITSLQVINNQRRILGTNNYMEQDNIGKKTTEDIVQNVLRNKSEQHTTQLNSNTGNRVFIKAVPIWNEDNTLAGVIYVEGNMEGVYAQLQRINGIFIKASILAVTVSALLGIIVARSITKPIKEMRRQALTMAQGDFSQKVNVYGNDEIGQLAETFNDLNDRLRDSRATTEEERRKLSSVLSDMSEGVIATDETGAVTLMNDAAGYLIGRDPDEVRGDFLLDVIKVEERVEDISELHENGSMVIDYSGEDELFLIRANFSIISDEEDQITGFITVLSDVTEQEKIEQERREFVSNVSHELRTPLTTMRSYLEALTDGAWEDKQIAPKFLNVTQNETERMIRMVNDLLQLSRMDSQEDTIHKEKVDFISYFHEVIDRFEMNTADRFTLKRRLPPSPLYVWLDKDKMTQVLDNIISNAIKYSPEGGTIHLDLKKQNRYLAVSIRDEGIGIPPDKQDKIFDRFYRADRARSRKLGGTGLGLAIAKELVEAHHGKIWAEGKEGQGTTILFTLPLISQKRRKRK